MNYSEKEIITVFKDKECLYKESGTISKVLVKHIKVDDWGVKLELKIIAGKQAINDFGDLEYEENQEVLNSCFTFSGAWEIASFSEMHLHVAYVGGELNGNPVSLQLFDRNETDYFKLWRPKY